MKNKMKVKKLLHVLPDASRKRIKELYGIDEDALLIRKVTTRNSEELKEGERAIIQYVSTRDIDRDNEILDPRGAILDEFKLAPQFLEAHDYSKAPLGSDEWIKADDYGIKAKSIYATTVRGEEYWTLRKEGHLKTSSIGFVPIKAVENGSEDWEKTAKKYSKKWDIDIEKLNTVSRIHTKYLVLEHSDVPVPANIHALTLAVAKGYGLSDEMIERLGIEQAKNYDEAVEIWSVCDGCGNRGVAYVFHNEMYKHLKNRTCTKCGLRNMAYTDKKGNPIETDFEDVKDDIAADADALIDELNKPEKPKEEPKPEPKPKRIIRFLGYDKPAIDIDAVVKRTVERELGQV